MVDIFGNRAAVETCGLLVTERTAGKFLIVLFSDAVLLDAVLDELLPGSRL